MTKSRRLAYFALLATAIIWGIAPPVIKYTLQFISPFTFLFYRFLIASLLVLIPFLLHCKKHPPTTKDFWLYLFLGFLCAPLNLILLFLGIERTTAIDASLISIISPILVIVGGVLLLKEKVTLQEKIGIAFTFAGTVLTVTQPILEAGPSVGKNISGNLLVLLGTFVWVVFTLLTKKYRHLDPFLLSSFSFLVGLIVFLPLVLTSHFSPTLPSLPALPGILFMAIFSSVFAYYFYVFGLTKIEASEASIFTYLQPIFAIPISVIFLKETLTAPFIVSALLITTGVFICEYRFPAKH